MIIFPLSLLSFSGYNIIIKATFFGKISGDILRLISIIAILSLPEYSWGQSVNIPPTKIEVIPPSPTASELAKYGTYPVDLSTGVPKIDIPLYSYEGANNGLSLEVQLSYHAGGIKVKQHATNVGLGWSLIAGGVITRTTNGIMDETPINGFWHYNAPDNYTDGNTPFELGLRPYNDIAAGVRDGQLDAFSFNFNGRSGSFYIGKNNDILFVKDQKLKVQWEVTSIPFGTQSLQAISKFTVIDEFGIKYIFDNYEITTALNAGTTAKRYAISSWHLSAIISPNAADKILFEYDHGTVSNYSSATQYSRAYFGDFSATSTILEKLSGSSSSQTSSTIKRIKKISFPDKTVMDVIYSPSQRLDLAGEYLIQDLKFTNQGNTKGYNLIQDYSLSKATLKEVIPYYRAGGSTMTDKGYTFSYATGNIIPNLNSGVDHWGYYLGNSVQGEHIPYEVLPDVPNLVGMKPYFDGINRKTDSVNVKIGSLQKITFPSGGYTIFEMEPHTADDPWLDKQVYITRPGDPWTNRTSSCYVSSNDRYKDNYTDFIYQGDNNSETIFTVTVPTSSSANCFSNCNIGVELFSSTNPSTMVLLSGTTISYSNNGASASFSAVNLVKGSTYRVVMYAQGFSSFTGYVSMQRKEPNSPQTITETYRDQQKFVGGLRVKSIKSYDHAAATVPANVWEYEYLEKDGTSSGVLGYYPKYTYSINMGYSTRFIGGYQYDPHYNSLGGVNKQVIIRSNSSIYPPEYVSGSLVTYKRVVEKSVVQGRNNGSIERRYSTGRANIISSIPQIPPQNASWGVGELLEETVIDEYNKRIRKTKNTFRLIGNAYYSNPVRRNNFRSLSLTPGRVLVGYNFSDDLSSVFTPFEQPIFYLSAEYFPYGGKSEKIATAEISYLGSDSVVVYKGLSYDPVNLYKRTDTLIYSDGKSKEVISYKYPHDLSAPGNVYQKMIDLNMIYPIVETNHKIIANGTPIILTGTKKWNYAERNLQPMMDRMQEFDRDKNVFFDVWKIDLHEPSGSPRQINIKDGPNMVYIWGYSGQYPIAKIENATYAEVKIALNDASETFINQLSSKIEPSLSDLSRLNALRNHAGMKKAHITTYTYKPMVGTISMTDSRGVTEYYVYDGFQRLTEVLDSEQNILKSYHYNYRP